MAETAFVAPRPDEWVGPGTISNEPFVAPRPDEWRGAGTISASDEANSALPPGLSVSQPRGVVPPALQGTQAPGWVSDLGYDGGKGPGTPPWRRPIVVRRPPPTAPPKPVQNIVKVGSPQIQLPPESKPGVGFINPQLTQPAANVLPQDRPSYAEGVEALQAGNIKQAHEILSQPPEFVSNAVDELNKFLVGPFQFHAGVIKAASSMTSPENVGIGLATGGLGAVAGAATAPVLQASAKALNAGLSTYFATQAGQSLAKESPGLLKAFKAGDLEGVAKSLGFISSDAMLIHFAGKHAAETVGQAPGGGTPPPPPPRPTGKASGLDQIFKGSPRVLAAKALRPNPSESTLLDRIEPTVAGIQEHGGVPEIKNNEDAIKATKQRIHYLQDTAFESYMEDGRKRNAVVPLASLAEGAREDIPILNQLEDQKGVEEFKKNMQAAYGKTTLSLDRARQFLKQLNGMVNKFYDKSTGARNAVTIASATEESRLVGLRDKLSEAIYQTLDPNGVDAEGNPDPGAGPRKIQMQTRDAMNFLDHAHQRRNAIAGEQPINRADAIANTMFSIADLPGKALHGNLEGGVSNVLRMGGSESDLNIKRLFKAVDKSKLEHTPMAGETPPAPPPVPPSSTTPPPTGDLGAQPPSNGAAGATPPPYDPATASAKLQQMLQERNAIAMKHTGKPYGSLTDDYDRMLVRNEQSPPPEQELNPDGTPALNTLGMPVERDRRTFANWPDRAAAYRAKASATTPPPTGDFAATPPEPPAPAPAAEPSAPPAPAPAAEPERTVQQVDWKTSRDINPELNASLAEGSTRLHPKGGLETLENVPLGKIDPEAGNKLNPDKVAEYMDKASPYAPELRIQPEGRFRAYEGHHRIAAMKAAEMGMTADEVRGMARDEGAKTSKALQDKLAAAPPAKGKMLAWTSEGDEFNYPKVATPADARAAGELAANPPEPAKPGEGRQPIKPNVNPAEGERSGANNLAALKPGNPGLSMEKEQFDPNSRLRKIVYRDEKGTPQGYLHFYLDDAQQQVAPPEHGLYPEVYVSPEARRQGIATKLYDEAKKQGFDLSKVSGTETTPNGAAFLNARAEAEAKPGEGGRPAGAPLRDYDTVQKEIDAKEDELEKKGHDLFSPDIDRRMKALANLHNDPDLGPLYKERDAIQKHQDTELASGLNDRLKSVVPNDAERAKLVNDIGEFSSSPALREAYRPGHWQQHLGHIANEALKWAKGDEPTYGRVRAVLSGTPDNPGIRLKLDLVGTLRPSKRAITRAQSVLDTLLEGNAPKFPVEGETGEIHQMPQLTAASSPQLNAPEAAQPAPAPTSSPRRLGEAEAEAPAAAGAEAKGGANPNLVTGSMSSAKTPSGRRIDVQYAVVDASEPIASHDLAGNENPAYPENRQPRDRTRQASEMQIQDFAKKLDPQELEPTFRATDGPPILDDKMMVESGNGRVNGLRLAYKTQPEKSAAYKQSVIEHAQRLGIPPESIAHIKEPILVRIRKTQMEPAELENFVRDANGKWGMDMAPQEDAVADARRMTPELLAKFRPGADGEIEHAGNQDFIRQFAKDILSPAEQNSFQTKDGEISQKGITRIRNAIFARAYGDTGALEKLVESTDSNIKNITNGMLAVAPKMVTLQEAGKAGTIYPNLDLAPDLGAAAAKLSALKARGTSVQDYLHQIAMADDGMSPEAKAMLDVFDKHSRAPKKIGRILEAYTESVEAAGDPNQQGMFGTGEAPTKGELLKAAVERTEKEFADERAKAAKVKALGPKSAVRADEAGGNGKTGEVAPADSGQENAPGGKDSGVQAQLGRTQRPPIGDLFGEETAKLSEAQAAAEAQGKAKLGGDQLTAEFKAPINADNRRTKLKKGAAPVQESMFGPPTPEPPQGGFDFKKEIADKGIKPDFSKKLDMKDVSGSIENMAIRSFKASADGKVPARVYIDDTGAALLGEVYASIQRHSPYDVRPDVTHDIGGLAMTEANAQAIIQKLRTNVSQTTASGKSALSDAAHARMNDLADAIEKATKGNPDGAIIANGATGRGIATIRDTIRHEFGHLQQYGVEASDTGTRPLVNYATAEKKIPFFKQAANALGKQGYNPKNISTMVKEILAVSGERTYDAETGKNRIGLTQDQMRQTVKGILDESVAIHGAKAYNLIYHGSKAFRKAVVTGARIPGPAGSARPPVAVAPGGPPSG